MAGGKFQQAVHIMTRASGGSAPGVFAWRGRWGRHVLELMAAAEMRYLDAVGVETVIVDQALGQHHRLRRAVRYDVDLPLQALEAMAVGVQEILVK